MMHIIITAADVWFVGKYALVGVGGFIVGFLFCASTSLPRW